MNLHLVLLVDIDIEDNLVLLGHVVPLAYVYLGIVESLVVEVFLCECLGACYHVRRYLRTLQQSEFLLHILSL